MASSAADTLEALPPLRDELRLAVDTIPGLVWTALPDGHIDFLNRRWLDYTGLTLSDASGWGWQAAIHPDDADALLEYWRSLLAAGTPGETEARLRRHDGEYRWFLFRGVPLYDEAGTLRKWYGQTTDIEDRKRAEMLLTGEKRLLELVARGYPLVEVLEALCRLVEEITPHCRCSIILYEPDKDRMRVAAAPSLPSTYVQVAENHPVSRCAGPCAMAAFRDEQIIVADVDADRAWDAHGWRELALAHGIKACWSTPIPALEGTVLGTFAVSFREPGRPSAYQQGVIEQFRNLASIAIERSAKEERFRRSEAYSAEAQRLSLTGSFSWCPVDGELVWSEQTYRIFGVDPAVRATFDLARERVHPDDRTLFDTTAKRAAAEGRDLAFEHRLRLPEGEVKHVQIFARAVRGDDGTLREFVGAVRDVTERKLREAALSRVREELAHVSRVATVGTLTASIAHEVNQPLTGIVTNASLCVRLLAAERPDMEGVMQAAKRVIRDANRAAEVIARLRSLFRKQSGAREPLDLNDAINEVLALASNEVQRSGAALRADLAPDLPLVVGDRTQLQQVVLNLLLNALEAMSGPACEWRVLTVATWLHETDVRVAVRDTGVGLDTSSLERLFEPFYTTKSGGMGMGLSISRSIVESHAGRLWAVPNEGPGATLTFALPSSPALTV